MGNGDAARLLTVVEEVRLSVLFGVVAYNLYGVLVRAYSTVRAETVEFTAGRAFGSGVEFFGEVQGRVGYVFVNTDGEVVFGFLVFKVFVNGFNH